MQKGAYQFFSQSCKGEKLDPGFSSISYDPGGD